MKLGQFCQLLNISLAGYVKDGLAMEIVKKCPKWMRVDFDFARERIVPNIDLDDISGKIDPQVELDLRNEIRSNYKNRPGKFEGQEPYVEYFWELDGDPVIFHAFGETDNDDVDEIEVRYKYKHQITKTDRFIFPELKQRRVIFLYADEQGFVTEVD